MVVLRLTVELLPLEGLGEIEKKPQSAEAVFGSLPPTLAFRRRAGGKKSVSSARAARFGKGLSASSDSSHQRHGGYI
jgi:hypothetical protein